MSESALRCDPRPTSDALDQDLQKHVEDKLECAQGIVRKGVMRQLKAF